MDAADAADAADVSDPAAVADAVDSGAAELLHSLSELLHQAASDLEAIDLQLRAKAPAPTARRDRARTVQKASWQLAGARVFSVLLRWWSDACIRRRGLEKGSLA